MNSKWLKAGVALIAAISIGGGGLAAVATAAEPACIPFDPTGVVCDTNVPTHQLSQGDPADDYKGFIFTTEEYPFDEAVFDDGWVHTGQYSAVRDSMTPTRIGATVKLPNVGVWTDSQGEKHQLDVTFTVKDTNGGTASSHGGKFGFSGLMSDTAVGKKVSDASPKPTDNTKRTGIQVEAVFTYAGTDTRVPDTFKGITGFSDLDGGGDAISNTEGVELVSGFDGIWLTDGNHLVNYGQDGYGGLRDMQDGNSVDERHFQQHLFAATFTGPSFTMRYSNGAFKSTFAMRFGTPIFSAQLVYKITAHAVDENGNEIKAPWTVADGLRVNGTYNLTDIPSIDGYEYVGPSENSAPLKGSVTSDGTSGDKTITLVYKKLASINYNGNGGKGTVAGETVVAGTDVDTKPNGFTRVGYTFKGWNTKADGSGTPYQPGADIRLDGNVTLYAMWEANPYKVAYAPNGGKGTMPEQTFAYDQTQPLDGNLFDRDGWTFTGWNTEKDGSGTAYADRQEVTNLTTENGGKVTLYAQWKADKAALHYDANADTATGDTPESEGVTGDAVTVNENGYANVGYTFTGWNTKPDGTGTSIDPGDKYTLPAGDTTVYAQWKANSYTVAFDANKGAGAMGEQTFQYDVKQALSGNMFTRDGYTFTGWNTKPDGSSTAYTDKQEVVNLTAQNGGKVTLYAQWKAAPSQLAYDANSDTATGETTATSGVTDQTVNAADNGYENQGYTFTGWNTMPDGTGSTIQPGDAVKLPAGGMTVYAQWTRIPGTVSWVKTDAQSGDILTGSEWRLDGPDGQSVTVTDNGETDTDPDDGGFIVTGLDWGDWTLTETKAPEGHDPIPAPLTFTIDAQHTTISLGDVENTRTPATVTYDANGGTGTTAPYEGVVGDTPQAAANGFTASGDCDAFGGWNTKPDGSGTSYKEGDMLPPLTGDLTLYAQWDESNCKAEGLAQTGISTTTTIFAAVLFTFVSTILAAFSRLLRRRS